VLQGIHYLGIKFYWAVKIVVPDAIPVIGPTVVELVVCGVGQSTLTRFYSLHTLFYLY
jgi:quinol-cytochrome oxidoreductase complex cytochrome b subunit